MGTRRQFVAVFLLFTLSPACAFFASTQPPPPLRSAETASCWVTPMNQAFGNVALGGAARMGAVGGALGMAMSAKPVQQMLITKPRTANCWYESKFLRTENNVCVLYKPSGLGPNQVWYGIYFDVIAQDRPVRIDGIRSACSSGAEGETLTVQTYTCTVGSSNGNEENPTVWELLGKKQMVLNTVNFDKKQTQQSADSYGDLPFDKSVTINPGEKRGFLVHTDHIGGLILRGGFGPMSVKNAWEVGSFTDETTAIRLSAGLPCSREIFKVEEDPIARGFVGTIQYTLL